MVSNMEGWLEAGRLAETKVNDMYICNFLSALKCMTLCFIHQRYT